MVGYETLPKIVVAMQIILAAVAVDAAIVAPGISGEEFVAARAGKYDFDELAGEPGHVIVRVTLAHAQIFQMPDELRQYPLHITRVHDDFVMLRLKKIRHDFGAAPLIK